MNSQPFTEMAAAAAAAAKPRPKGVPDDAVPMPCMTERGPSLRFDIARSADVMHNETEAQAAARGQEVAAVYEAAEQATTAEGRIAIDTQRKNSLVAAEQAKELATRYVVAESEAYSKGVQAAEERRTASMQAAKRATKVAGAYERGDREATRVMPRLMLLAAVAVLALAIGVAMAWPAAVPPAEDALDGLTANGKKAA